MTPIYQAETIITAADESSSGGALSSLMSSFSAIPGLSGFGGIGGRRGEVAQAIVTMTSPYFTREFIKDNNLLPILFADSWDDETGDWDVSEEDIPTLADGYRKFEEDIRKIEEDDFGIVRLIIEWKDPNVAADWANATVGRLNEKLRLQAIEEANKTIVYLNKEVEKTRIVELQQAIYRMIESQVNVRTMANVKKEYAFKVISPAIAADPDEFIKPDRSLIISVGVIFGIAFGAFISFCMFAFKRIRKELAE